MGMEKAHLQEERFGIGKCGLNSAPLSQGRLALGPVALGPVALGARAAEAEAVEMLAIKVLALNMDLMAEGPEVVERHGHGVGEVEGGVGGGGGDVQEAPRLEELVVGETPILPAKHQGRPIHDRGLSWGPALWSQKPGQGLARGPQGQGRPLQPTGSGHHPATIGEGCGQVGIDLCPLKVGYAMDSHLAGFCAEWIAAGRHQAQLIHAEIGTQPSNAAHVSGASGLNEHQKERQGKLWRNASRSAMVWGSGWKRGMGGVRPLTTCWMS